MGILQGCLLWPLLFLGLAALVAGVTSPGCKRTLSCDFEQPPVYDFFHPPDILCGFTGQNGSEGNQWMSGMNFPNIPSGDGLFVYTLQGIKDTTQRADLTSLPVCDSVGVIVTFTFVITSQSQLQVLTQCQGQSSVRDQRVYNYDPNFVKTWRPSKITLRACTNCYTKVIFRASWSNFEGTEAVAVDNIHITTTTSIPKGAITPEPTTPTPKPTPRRTPSDSTITQSGFNAPQSGNDDSKRTYVIVGSILGVLAFVIICLVVVFFVRRRFKPRLSDEMTLDKTSGEQNG